MTHTIPPASQSVLAGQKFYRIVQEQPVPGDLIPVDASATAIAVGPDSDFAQYEIFYPDPLAPNGVRRATISVDKPWLATTLVDLTKNTGYQTASPQKLLAGKLYIVPADIFGVTDPEFEIDPVIDLIVFTGNITSQLPNRSRKSRRGPLRFGAQDIYSFPVYGRRYYDVEVAIVDNLPPAESYSGSFDVSLWGGTTVLPYVETDGSQLINLTELVAPVTLDSTGDLVFKTLYDALEPGSKGRFDVLQLKIDNATNPNDGASYAGGVTLKLEFSD